ncbi:MAG: hydrogenase maturation nickel metallochaperone HypA [Thermoguttaceae bacterium]|jgi:hydrogenase nickel incorporation protein HypA/HybF
MHELSIVDALIEQVAREVHRSGQSGKVRAVQLSIGRLSGVNCDSVRFAFELLAPGTLVEGAEVVIHEVKAACRCQTCNARVEIDDLVFKCPKCASDAVTIEGGRDLLLQSIDLEDKQKVDSG